jgi:hypothetical protein
MAERDPGGRRRSPPDRRSRRDGNGGRWTGSDARPRDRAQTVHDFAFGIGIFVVAAVFVVAFVPGVTTPYATGITETEQEQAEAVARTLMGNVSDAPGEANATRLETFFEHDWDEPELQHRLGLPADAGLNVTLREPGPGGEVVNAYRLGEPYENRSASTVARVLRVDGEIRRLEVRVW